MSGDTINNYYAARPLDDEEVWLRAMYACLSCPEENASNSALIADDALVEFRKRFPRKIEAKNAESV